MRQGSEEWHQARLGKCTASRVKDALAFLKNGEPAAARNKYMIELVCERLTGIPAQHFVSDAMVWGSENESLARAEYEAMTGREVDLVGLIDHPTIAMFAASPDGLVGSDGLAEYKCPTTATHIDWMLAGVVPTDHEYQCLAQMSCSERAWVDFMSFEPRLPQRHQRFLRRMERDEKRIATMEDGVRLFLQEVADLIGRMEELNPEVPLRERLKQSLEMEPITGGHEVWREVADSLAGDDRWMTA